MEAQNVHQCIAAVQSALVKEGIGKTRRNTQQGYQFRGIDDVYNAISPVLADVGLVILPSYTTRELIERTSQADKALFNVTVQGNYKLVSAHDGSIEYAGPFWGEAMDAADKATNKAMSAAYKYMAMQVFAIPTEGDNDADTTTHDVRSRITPTAGVMETLPIERQKEVRWYAEQILSAFSLTKDIVLAFANYETAKGSLESEEQVALRGLLPSDCKTALRKFGEETKKNQLRAMAGSQA